jgi:ATP-dependent RNA helicase DeaD
MTFKDLGLSDKIIKNLSDIGFVNPTPIQQEVITYIQTTDSDLIGLAQTGTGKTAAFGLPMIEKVDFESKQLQALIICPTRELCVQICKDLNTYAKPFPDKQIIPVYGGVSIDTQIRQLKSGVQIVVATPGRCMDLLKRKVIKTTGIKYFILDEADEMLNMGFQEDIREIFNQLPEEKSVWLFSATLSPSIRKIAMEYMKSPKEIAVGKKNSTAENLSHVYYSVHEKNRYLALKRIIDFNPDIYGVIFCRTKEDTRRIAEKLIEDGYSCAPIHGDLSQSQRETVMSSFRSKSLQILVATDVAARGIDVTGITHVIHHHLPDDTESYTHRSGRTARAGKKGASIALVNKREMNKIRDIEHFIKIKFQVAKVPTGTEVCEKQLHHLIDKVANTPVNSTAINPYMEEIDQKLGHLSPHEIIQKFISAEFNRFLDYYKNAVDFNDSGDDFSRSRSDRFERNDRGSDRRRDDRGSDRRPARRDDDRRSDDRRGDRRSDDRRSDRRDDRGSERRPARRDDDKDFKRYFIGLGDNDSIRPGGIIKELCDQTGINSKNIGRIEIKDDFSFIDIKHDDLGKLEKVMNGKFTINGLKTNIEPAKERK